MQTNYSTGKPDTLSFKYVQTIDASEKLHPSEKFNCRGGNSIEYSLF